jgi:hypothetical protein
VVPFSEDVFDALEEGIYYYCYVFAIIPVFSEITFTRSAFVI